MIGRLLKIIGLICKRALLKRLYSAKETYNFKEPTNRSHPILLLLQLPLWRVSRYTVLHHRFDAQFLQPRGNLPQSVAFGVSVCCIWSAEVVLLKYTVLHHRFDAQFLQPRGNLLQSVAFGVSFLLSQISIDTLVLYVSRSLLPRSVEKRAMRLRLEIEMKWHSKCNRLYYIIRFDAS